MWIFLLHILSVRFDKEFYFFTGFVPRQVHLIGVVGDVNTFDKVQMASDSIPSLIFSHAVIIINYLQSRFIFLSGQT